jgi:hypothetical protein
MAARIALVLIGVGDRGGILVARLDLRWICVGFVLVALREVSVITQFLRSSWRKIRGKSGAVFGIQIQFG